MGKFFFQVPNVCYITNHQGLEVEEFFLFLGPSGTFHNNQYLLEGSEVVQIPKLLTFSQLVRFHANDMLLPGKGLRSP
jgi:hypothetical protein